MVIKSEQIALIWKGIARWMNEKGISPVELARFTSYSREHIEKGTKYFSERLDSDFLTDCIDAFGLRNARTRSFEDGAEILSDDEKIYLLTAILIVQPKQGNFWDK